MNKIYSFSYLFLIAISAVICIASCEHKPKTLISPTLTKDTIKPPKIKCNQDSVYFVNTILPLLISNCNGPGCHNAAENADGVTLTNFSNIKKYVIAGNATGSKLYKNMTVSSKIMPPSGKLSQATLNLIEKWINQGAKNNYCNDDCDTTQFAYNANIATIINTNCMGCHATGTTKIGTHTELKTQVDNGKLWGSINHFSGFLAMPNASTFLKDCDIKKIQKWIAAGAPNN